MPRKLVKTTDITREQWLEYRRTGLGGSDAAVVMGLTPYRSKIELWADKTGRMPETEDNEAMRTGRDLQSASARLPERRSAAATTYSSTMNTTS